MCLCDSPVNRIHSSNPTLDYTLRNRSLVICTNVISVFIPLNVIIFLQIQPSAESPDDYDLFIALTLGGLQYRKYLIQFPQSKSKKADDGLTYAARVVTFKRRNVREWKKTGQMLLPVINECYVLLFDQETNLLDSIKVK